MNIEIFYFLICILLPRLVTQWDNKEKFRQASAYFWILLFELILILPMLNFNSWFLVALLLIIYHGFQIILNKFSKIISLNRFLEFFLVLILSSFVFGIFKDNIYFSKFAFFITNGIIKNNILLSKYDPQVIKRGIIYLFAVLVLVNEINHLVRYILNVIKIEPRLQDNRASGSVSLNTNVDMEELNRGKIIGVIERILFFTFVLLGNYFTIAFIITAKGVTRFNELSEKYFAEYVLIGTLLSATLSVLWAYYIVGLLKLL